MNNNFHMQSSEKINTLHISFKKRYENMTAENWREQLASYINEVLLFSGDPADERMITGWVAALCEHAYYNAAYQKALNVRLDFEHQFNEMLASIRLPEFLTRPGQIICGKRQPSFVESISPTLERFQVMEALPEVFGDAIDSIIVGGSMSYAPFFSVRGNQTDKDVSDIDALVVINESFFKKSSWKKFTVSELFPVIEKRKFFDRIKIFQKLLRTDAADVFSQRFSVCGRSFTVSIHFMNLSVFRRMVYTDLDKSFKKGTDVHYVLRDFRTDPFTHPCHARHTFNGGRIESVIDGHEIDLGGFISSMPGYTISSGKFYPGVYHTVISPAFLVFCDHTGETLRLIKKFEDILYREVSLVRREFPSATYAKAHNRYDIFAPGRFEEGFNSFISPRNIQKYNPSPSLSIIEIESAILPEEIISNNMKSEKKNEYARNEVSKSLEEWQKETLKSIDIEIEEFLAPENSELILLLAKRQNLHWYTVAFIRSVKKMAIRLPYPYRRSTDSVIREEICTQVITPDVIMRSSAYEKLMRRFGKAYVATIADPSGQDKSKPIGYALVIPIK